MGRPAGSKNKPKEEEEEEEEELTIDTSEGGLATTSSLREEKSSEDEDFSMYMPEEIHAEPTVGSGINADPNATPASVMLAIGRLYNDAGIVSDALSKHLRNVAGEPELFTFLQRMQNALGDFRHMVEQVEGGISEELMNAIESAVA